MERERRGTRLQTIHIEDGCAAPPRRSREEVGDLAAHHHADDRVRGSGGDVAAPRVPSVAQHDETVGDRFHLFDEMRDVDDGAALRFQAAHQREQPRDVVAPEAARRLVEHEDAAARRKGARDLHELLRGDGERLDARSGVDLVVTELGQRAGRRVAHPRPVEQAESRGLHPEQDVFHHRQVRSERELLINRRDAGAARLERAARREPPAVDAHRTRVAGERAGEDGHQRALARAVLTDEREDLARADRQVHAVQRHRRAERLLDAAHLEARILHVVTALRRTAPGVSGFGRTLHFSHFDRSGSSRAFMPG